MQRLQSLGQVVLDLGSTLVADNLEGLQYLLRRLERIAKSCPLVSSTVTGWTKLLNEAVSEHWRGGRLLSKSLI